jgi:hypothetical protein
MQAVGGISAVMACGAMRCDAIQAQLSQRLLSLRHRAEGRIEFESRRRLGSEEEYVDHS